jgi:hypothetical protein
LPHGRAEIDIRKEYTPMKIVFVVLLIVHGLIVAAQSSGSFNPTGGLQNPAWLGWWPTNLGQSWLLSGLGIEKSLIARAGGLIWLAAGLSLVAAGLGAMGLFVPVTWWRTLALSGAALSLAMLIFYLHPFYGVGLAASAVLLAVLIGTSWSPLERFGL